MDYAIDQNWRETNPAREKARRLKEVREPIVLPPIEDIEYVLIPLTGGMADIARFALATGMRKSEVVYLERPHIRGSLCFIAKGKGRKSRTIELNAEALSLLAKQPISIKSKYVFHHDGEPYTAISSNWRRAVKTAQRTAHKIDRDFTPFRFHDLRHVFAVTQLQSGQKGIYELSKHLGHSSVMTTEQHYLKFLTPEQAKAAKDGTKDGTREAVSTVPSVAQAIENKG